MKTSLDIPLQDIQRRLAMDNPWWQAGREIDEEEHSMAHRAYFPAFAAIAQDRSVRRATVLIGPRRVGKTVMLHQFVQKLLDDGIRGIDILFLSLDTPLYAGLSLERLLRLFMDIHRHSDNDALWVLFDEVQYLKDWGVHLKSLVDSYPNVKFIASGSAAAALKMKSMESGAGRFTDFFLPPLTFAEFLQFTGQEKALLRPAPPTDPLGLTYLCTDIEALNNSFIDYVNFGGFPEAVMNPSVRANPSRFLRQDIVDKVLLKDLPSLYGISDTQALNRFFNVLAYNTGEEFSLESLSQHSDINKQKLADFLEYLEAAYLIRRVHRVDNNAERLKRARTFKIYLTNPSMRAALFGSLAQEDKSVGMVAETAVWSQWLHAQEATSSLYYARWKEGRKDREVDIVSMDTRTQKPTLVIEVKWSDRIIDHSEELSALVTMAAKYSLQNTAILSTRTIMKVLNVDGVKINCIPTALLCYSIAKEEK